MENVRPAMCGDRCYAPPQCHSWYFYHCDVEPAMLKQKQLDWYLKWRCVFEFGISATTNKSSSVCLSGEEVGVDSKPVAIVWHTNSFFLLFEKTFIIAILEEKKNLKNISYNKHQAEVDCTPYNPHYETPSSKIVIYFRYFERPLFS